MEPRCTRARRGCVATTALLALGCGRLGFDAAPDAARDAAIDARVDAAPACDPSFQPLPATATRYLFVPTPTAWDAARAACEAFGPGHGLAVLASEAERIAVNDRAESLAPSRWWLGGHDRDVEGTWTDVAGVPLTYLPWAQGEPNNTNGNEHCLDVLADLGEGVNRFGRFDDRTCSATYPYVCSCVLP